MDLRNFTSKKEEKKSKNIVKKKGVDISQEDNKLVFQFSNVEDMKKYEDYLFFSPTNAIIPTDEKELLDYFQKSKEEGVEGLMVKALEAPYKPGIRTGNMAKLKETMEDLDLVIVGAEYGTGKRAGFYSSFIVAVRNPEAMDESEEYLVIGKVSSGVKELGDIGASISNLSTLLEPLKIGEEGDQVFFEPKIILQVRYQEIQKSTIYSSGYALRFPRIISLREDKALDEINTITDIDRLVK